MKSDARAEAVHVSVAQDGDGGVGLQGLDESVELGAGGV